MIKAIVSNEFKTELGIIRTWIKSDRDIEIQNSCIKNNKYEQNTSITPAHKITLETFELSNEWITDRMSFESSKGWRWFVEKINNKAENLMIYCTLINPSNDTECNGDDGEYLDAVEIENKTHQLHIGTEDSKAMHGRAFHDRFMPPRFEKKLFLEQEEGSYDLFTEQIDFGFKTTIPQLKKTEKIYFHYLVATNKIKPSLEYPNTRDCSTWYAVEKSKTFLDRYLEQGNG